MRSVTGCVRDGERERESSLRRRREEEGKERMRDGWLTQSRADV